MCCVERETGLLVHSADLMYLDMARNTRYPPATFHPTIGHIVRVHHSVTE